MRTVVVGVGNPLRGDDAVGLHVARAVREAMAARDDVSVVELWAGGLRLAEAISGFERAVIVDAVLTRGAEPGTVLALRLDELEHSRTTTCMHDTSLPTALELWRRAGEPLPLDIVVFGVAAVAMDTLSEALSPAVAACVPVATARVVAHLERA